LAAPLTNVRSVALILLAAFLVALGCRKSKEAAGVSLPPPLVPYLSPATRILAGIELGSLQKTPFYQQQKTRLGAPQFALLAERFGINMQQDISSVFLSWGNTAQPLILVQGSFQPPKIQQALRSLGGTVGSYKSMTLLTYAGQAAYAGPHLLAIASPPQLQTAIAREQAGPGSLPPELQSRLQELRPQDQIWITSRSGLPLVAPPKRADLSSALSNITGYVSGVSVGLTIDAGLHLKAHLLCISDAGALRVRDAFRGALALARLTAHDPTLPVLLNAVHVRQNGIEVLLQADLSPELSAALLRYLPAWTLPEPH
jgi:hypothetical protein